MLHPLGTSVWLRDPVSLKKDACLTLCDVVDIQDFLSMVLNGSAGVWLR